MSRQFIVSALSALFALGAVACKEDKPAPTEGAAPAASVTAPAAATPAALPPLSPEKPATALGTVPTPEDLEGEAERTVRVDNLEAELDRLEAEITAGP